MNNIPIIAFSAWSGTGKTTIIEKLIPCLKDRGFRVAVIKHDAHDFEIDREGKDSWRFSHAGADATVIASASKAALILQKEASLQELVSMIRDVDIILVEGYNNEDLPSIGISRRATGKGLRKPPESCIAIVTDEETDGNVPTFSFDNIQGLSNFVISYINNFPHLPCHQASLI